MRLNIATLVSSVAKGMPSSLATEEGGVMNRIVGTCPVCGDEMRVVRLRCRGCDTALDGNFELSRFLRLTPEQLYFV